MLLEGVQPPVKDSPADFGGVVLRWLCAQHLALAACEDCMAGWVHGGS